MKKNFFFLLVALMAGLTMVKADELTVNNGTTTNSYIPFYGYDCDGSAMHTQFVIPASSLADLAGSEITAMQFSQSSAVTNKVNSNMWHVKLLEIASSTLSSFVDVSSATEVYVGNFPWGTTTPTLEFSNSFVYSGENLLVDFQYSGSGNWASISFNGVEATGASLYNGGQKNFLPKITFTYESLASCKKPASFKVSDITAEGATISWDAVLGAAGYEYAIVPEGSTIDAVTPAATTEISVNITGLEAQSNYTAYVRANCGGGDYSAWRSAEFTTPCNPITEYPYTHNFEDDTNGGSSFYTSFIDCWGHLSNATGSYIGYPYVSSSYGHNGGKCLAFSSSFSCGTTQIAVLPMLDGVASGYAMEFYVRGANSTSANLYVGVMTDPTDPSKFTQVKSVYVSGTSYTKISVDAELEKYVGTGRYLALKPSRVTSSYSSSTTIYVDDITITKVTCKNPSNLIVSNIAETSADLAWTANGDESQWLIRYKKSTEALWNSGEVVSQNPYTISGLASGTAYDFEVYAYCSASDQSPKAAANSFRTLCDTQDADSWAENFDSYPSTNAQETAEAGCFTFLNHGGTSAYPKAYVNNNSTYAASGNCLLLQALSGKDPIYAILPAFTQDLSAYRLLFDTKIENRSYGKVCVGYLTNPSDASTWTLIQEVVGTADKTVDHQVVSLSSVPAGARVAIRYGEVSSSWYQIGIDNVSLELIPSCVEVSGVAVSNVAATSASISWTAGATESAWDIQYKKTAEAGWTTVNNVTENPYVLEGLSAKTAYEVQVRARCNESDLSSWSASKSFTTLALPMAIPYFEGFEDYTGSTYSSGTVIPDDWSTAGTTASVKPHVIASGNSYCYTKNGSKALTFYGRGYCYATLPAFDQPLNLLTITFWMQQESATTGKLTLGYITAEDVNMNTFTVIEEYAGAGSITERSTKLNTLPANAYKLVFCWYCANQYSCCIDDITIDFIRCDAPTPAVSSIATSSVVLSAGIADINWEYKIGESGAEVPVSANTPATVEGLSANTEYTINVRTACSESDKSNWIPVNFHTACEAIEANGYAEDFSSESQIPSCMKAIGASYSATDGVDNSACVTLGNAAIILPVFSNGDYNGLQLNFSASANSESKLYVIAYDESNDNLATQEKLAEVDLLISAFQTYTIYFSTIDGINTKLAGKRIGFYHTVAALAFVDNIAIQAESTFRAPSDLALSDGTITDEGAAFTFEQTGEPTNEWVYEVATDNTFATLVASETITAKSFTLSGLKMKTTYYVRVKQMNGSESSNYSNIVTFTTECGKFALGVVDNLDGYNSTTADQGGKLNVPNCWTAYNERNYSPWQYAYILNKSAKAHSGNNVLSLTCHTYSSNKQMTWMALPQIEYTDINNVAVEFYASASSNGYKLEVGLMSDPTDKNTYVALKQITLTDTMEKYVVRVDEYVGGADLTGKNYVVFMNNKTYGTLYVDDIKVAESACAMAQDAAVSALTDVSAMLSISNETPNWNVVVKKGETEVFAQAGITEASVTATGLSAQTDYVAYITMNCSQDGESEAVEVAFTTACAALTDADVDADGVLYFQNFENGFDACGAVVSTSTTYPQICSTPAHVYAGSKSVEFFSSNPGAIVLPAMNITWASYELSFYAKLWSGSAAKNFYVAVASEVPAVDEVTSLDVVATFSIPNATFAEYKVAFAEVDAAKLASAKYIVIYATSGDILVDNIQMTHKATIRENLTSGKMGTICYGYDLTHISGATFYEPEYFDGFYIGFKEADEVKAGYGYLFVAEAEAITAFKSGTELTSAVDAAEAGNHMQGTLSDIMLPAGTTDYCGLASGHWQYFGEYNKMTAGHAYVVLKDMPNEPESALAPGRRRIVLSSNGATVTTGIDFSDSDVMAVKVLQNGNLYIIRDSKMYNAEGQLVK